MVERKEMLTIDERDEIAHLKEFVPEIGDEMIRYSFEHLLKKLQ